MAEAIPGADSDGYPLPAGLQPTSFLGPVSACPPEYADVPVRDVVAQINAERQNRVAAGEREVLAPGFRSRTPAGTAGSGTGFESGGVLDVSAPSAMLAGLTDSVTRDGRIAELDDDELIGAMRAWKRLESWCSANLLTAVAELARRRPAEGTAAAAPGEFPGQVSEFANDEVAAALTLTSQAADTCTALSLDLAIRLPASAAAHRAGLIDYPKARLIAEATRILSDDDARQVEALVLPKAAEQTTGQLRAALARAVIAVDPGAAARRREEALKDPRVCRWQEDAGTAALAGHSLPPADVLAADQRLTARALALRDAGLPGSVGELRARAYLDALLDRDSTPTPSEPAPTGPGTSAPPPADPADPADPVGPAAPPPGPPPSPRLPALINLTLPLATQLGLADDPGVVAGFGPVDPVLARQLATLAAADPRSRCCVTLIGPDGRAVGHGCLPGPGALANLTTRGLTLSITPLAQDTCDHRSREPGYEPSRRLQHLIWARSTSCTAPGCRRPAARCDLDHTVPYDQRGPTCPCNLAPLCRHHHRCKHSQGWRLDQPSPGVMRWITPAGRQYTTKPNAF